MIPGRDASTARGRRWFVRIAAAAVFGVTMAGLVWAESSAQEASRADLIQRFDVRGTSAANFLSSYTGYILSQEQKLAEQRLATATVTDAQFHQFLDDFGFGPAVLLDASGRDLDVAPYKASVIGTDLATRYAHLASAVAGRPAVSNIVASAAQGVPVVAFATPFNTPFGNRVISGAFDLASRPMGLYLRHVLPYSSTVSSVYLLDAAGKAIVAGDGQPATLPAVLAHAPLGGGRVVVDGRPMEFTSTAVASTPWRLTMAVSEATLFQPISQESRILPWLFLLALGAAGALLLVLFVRHREARNMAVMDARTDPLTGLANRRAVEEILALRVGDRRRSGLCAGVLILDVDHFKDINDRYGHPAGDAALKAIAARASSCLRVNDVLGRWGGEEFVVVAAPAADDDLFTIGERIRTAISGAPLSFAHHTATMTISVGAAAADGEAGPLELIARADAALYQAKHGGRDRTVMSGTEATPATT